MWDYVCFLVSYTLCSHFQAFRTIPIFCPLGRVSQNQDADGHFGGMDICSVWQELRSWSSARKDTSGIWGRIISHQFSTSWSWIPMIPWRSSFHLLILFCCVDTAGVPFGPSLLGLHSPDLAAKKTCETPSSPKAKLRNPEPCTGSSQNTLLGSGWKGSSGNWESGLMEHDGTIQVTSL